MSKKNKAKESDIEVMVSEDVHAFLVYVAELANTSPGKAASVILAMVTAKHIKKDETK